MTKLDLTPPDTTRPRLTPAVSTSLLRELYHSAYLSALRGASTDAFPHDSPLDPGSDGRGDTTVQSQSVFARRGRETAIFDRWIAVRVGSELRQVESSLSEEGEAEEDVIKRLQVGRSRRDFLLLLQGRVRWTAAAKVPGQRLLLQLVPRRMRNMYRGNR
jgi:hypothetical protein